MHFKNILSILFLSTIVACGGGGGGSSSIELPIPNIAPTISGSITEIRVGEEINNMAKIDKIESGKNSLKWKKSRRRKSFLEVNGEMKVFFKKAKVVKKGLNNNIYF